MLRFILGFGIGFVVVGGVLIGYSFFEENPVDFAEEFDGAVDDAVFQATGELQKHSYDMCRKRVLKQGVCEGFSHVVCRNEVSKRCNPNDPNYTGAK